MADVYDYGTGQRSKPKKRWKKGIPCRCSDRYCRARKTLAKHPDEYSHAQRRFKLCPVCPRELSPDKFRMSVESKKQTCWCDHYPFPHRAGSLFCTEGALGKQGISFYNRNDPEVQQMMDKISGRTEN